MVAMIFPLKKLLHNSKYLVFGTILLLGIVIVFHEMVEMESWGECVFLLSNNMSKLLLNWCIIFRQCLDLIGNL